MSKYHDPNWDPYRQGDPHSQVDPYGHPNPYGRPPRKGGGLVLIVVLILGGLGSLFLVAFVGIVIAIASMENQFGDLAYPGDLNSDEPVQPIDWQQARQAFRRRRPSGQRRDDRQGAARGR